MIISVVTVMAHPVKTVGFLGTNDWVCVVALVWMIQSGAFVFGSGAVILGRFCGYNTIPPGNGIVYVLTALTVGIFGLFFGLYLNDGVEQKNPNKLLVWMLYACFVQLLLVVDLGIYLVHYPVEENWENILGIIICLLIYSVLILLVNIHRKALELMLEDSLRQQRLARGGLVSIEMHNISKTTLITQLSSSLSQP